MTCHKSFFRTFIHYFREEKKDKDRDELWKQLDQLKLEHDSKTKALTQQEATKK